MPEIKNVYTFSNVSPDILNNECLQSLKEIGAVDIFEKQPVPGDIQKIITAYIKSSLWGGGGFNLECRIYVQDGITNMELKGYIAQYAVSPLTGAMDKLMLQLKKQLHDKYNFEFQYEKLTRFFPKYKIISNKRDKYFLIYGLLTSFGYAFGHFLINRGKEFGLAMIVMIICYHFGSNYLLKAEKPDQTKV